uniref:Uncharacterized protein n=1 Tax=Rhodosorus marinus TaxID=101924 RepID=A0A7S2ZG97_9RHOD|mmetsp:Transcript_179/g.389  ORF Transcript_179/g.389 Transcript_179/m.389 type:complete len:101 (+) Transcript_179:332-634(+)
MRLLERIPLQVCRSSAQHTYVSRFQGKYAAQNSAFDRRDSGRRLDGNQEELKRMEEASRRKQLFLCAHSPMRRRYRLAEYDSRQTTNILKVIQISSYLVI